ncbi:uncharacterized protein BX664DRAFT_334142 [Halteromyces radiatus]|uniref:uncharacterized protein n=1 Tax=Halteromyces radiatus TaxID=101107 RepID=UPI002220DA26|nr:uncharacterized protein BX664DRAFT_334142 [Halteromyces radiatus]KAI8089879.1 hypothetical protein BX664DRAFT_334142 [Halteromyces radiatus]
MLEKDLFAGVVTSLCFHSEKVIVVGHGPFLKLYNVLTGKLLTCQEVLPNNRIHRITFVPKIDINQGTETRMMAVYGSKYIAIVKITIVEDEDHASIDIIESLGPFCDWILDVQWLKVGVSHPSDHIKVEGEP